MTQQSGKTKYFIYARKSSESEDRQVQSIDDQLLRLRELASERGLLVVDELTEARSAKTPYARPVFDSMLSRIERGDATGILCWQINRLSRNPIESGRLAWMLQRAVITSLQTIEREFRPDDNVLLFSVETGMANQYILDLSRNVKRGMRGKLERGGYPFLAPLGYLNDPATRAVVKDPERFGILRLAWEELLTGAYSVPEVLKKVNEEWGFRTRPRKRTEGKPIGRSELYRIFGNPFYAGIVRVNGDEFRGSHEPMVTIDEFQEGQRLLGRSVRRERSKHYTPFTGFMRCGECGCTVVVDVHFKKLRGSGQLKRYAYYHCTWQKPLTLCTQREYVPEEAIYQQIGAELQRFSIDERAYEAGMQQLERAFGDRVAEQRAVNAAIQQGIDQTRRQLSNLTHMRASDQISESEFLEERQVALNRLNGLERERGTFDRRVTRLTEQLKADLLLLVDLSARFRAGDVQTQRSILLRLGSNYTLLNGKVRFEAKKWLKPIERIASRASSPDDRLEPPRNPIENAKRDDSSSLCLIWSAICNEIWNVMLKLADEELEEWCLDPTISEPRKAA